MYNITCPKCGYNKQVNTYNTFTDKCCNNCGFDELEVVVYKENYLGENFPNINNSMNQNTNWTNNIKKINNERLESQKLQEKLSPITKEEIADFVIDLYTKQFTNWLKKGK